MEVCGQLHAPAPLPPGKSPPSTHWIGGWVAPRVGLDGVEKRKSFAAGNRTRAIQPVARRYPDSCLSVGHENSSRNLLVTSVYVAGKYWSIKYFSAIRIRNALIYGAFVGSIFLKLESIHPYWWCYLHLSVNTVLTRNHVVEFDETWYRRSSLKFFMLIVNFECRRWVFSCPSYSVGPQFESRPGNLLSANERNEAESFLKS
jgi:hypothetical protein